MTADRSRPLKAVLWNALTWGAAWGIAGGAIAAVLSLFAPGPGVASLTHRIGSALFAGLLWGVRFGVAGAAIGTAFAAVVRLRYLGRRLADINPVRFALLGAVVGGVGVPLFLQLMNVLSGDGPVAWRLVLDDARWASVFGAVAAASSIMLARRAESLPDAPRQDRLEGGNDLTDRPFGDEQEAAKSPRPPSGTSRSG